MSLRLIIEDDEGSTTVVPLAADAITIGRQQGNTIQLTEKNVSRQHARLFPEQESWVIEDLGSYNGIKVNNETIDGRTALREGDVVEIGDYHLAITEDVDKSPLGLRTGAAANGAGPEPMLVSSSADLPRLSPDEIAALQSGQQAATPPPSAILDSGPMAAGQYHPGYASQPEERKSNAGLLIFLGMAFLGLLLVGAFFVFGSGDKSDEVASSDGKAEPKEKSGKGEPNGGATPPVADDGPVPEPPPADGGAVDSSGEPAVAEESDGGDEAAAEADDGEIVEDDDDGGDEPVEIIEDEPTPKPKPKSKPKPKPKSKPKPSIDADKMLKDARKLQYTDPGATFRMAKESYEAKPVRDALWVMGFAACRLKDKSKAQYVLKRLKGADRTKLKEHCAQKGLEL